MTLKSGEVFFSEQNNSFVIPESVSLFGLSVSFYGLLLVLAALVSIIVIGEVVRRKQQETEKSLTLITLIIVFALAGARIYYILFEWQAFIREPMAVFQFRSGGLSYFGALFGAWFAVKWYCRRTKTDFFQYADTLSVGAASAAPFVWVGCAFVREPLGRFYDGLFSVSVGAEYLTEEISGRYVDELLENSWYADDSVRYVRMHPVAVYGMILSILFFIILCMCVAKTKTDGGVFTVYLVMNATGVSVLEWFRADRAYLWGTEISVNYVVSAVIIVTIFSGKMRQLLKHRKEKRRMFIPQ